MSGRVLPDGAAVSNHFSASFAPHVIEANLTSCNGVSDKLEVTPGPDNRGYATGRGTLGSMTVGIPAHDPACQSFHDWKEKCENGAIGHQATGTVTEMTAGDVPVTIWEVTNCICHEVSTVDMKIDGGEVVVHMFVISFARAKRIGP